MIGDDTDGWKEYTHELTKEEYEKYLNPMAKAFQNKIGKENLISSKQIIKSMKEHGFKISLARLAKIVAFIRKHDVIKCLVSCGKGYFIATERKDCIYHLKSIDARIHSLKDVRDSMYSQMVERFGEPEPDEWKD